MKSIENKYYNLRENKNINKKEYFVKIIELLEKLIPYTDIREANNKDARELHKKLLEEFEEEDIFSVFYKISEITLQNQTLKDWADTLEIIILRLENNEYDQDISYYHIKRSAKELKSILKKINYEKSIVTISENQVPKIEYYLYPRLESILNNLEDKSTLYYKSQVGKYDYLNVNYLIKTKQCLNNLKLLLYTDINQLDDVAKLNLQYQKDIDVLEMKYPNNAPFKTNISLGNRSKYPNKYQKEVLEKYNKKLNSDTNLELYQKELKVLNKLNIDFKTIINNEEENNSFKLTISKIVNQVENLTRIHEKLKYNDYYGVYSIDLEMVHNCFFEWMKIQDSIKNSLIIKYSNDNKYDFHRTLIDDCYPKISLEKNSQLTFITPEYIWWATEHDLEKLGKNSIKYEEELEIIQSLNKLSLRVEKICDPNLKFDLFSSEELKQEYNNIKKVFKNFHDIYPKIRYLDIGEKVFTRLWWKDCELQEELFGNDYDRFRDANDVYEFNIPEDIPNHLTLTGNIFNNE